MKTILFILLLHTFPVLAQNRPCTQSEVNQDRTGPGIASTTRNGFTITTSSGEECDVAPGVVMGTFDSAPALQAPGAPRTGATASGTSRECPPEVMSQLRSGVLSSYSDPANIPMQGGGTCDATRLRAQQDEQTADQQEAELAGQKNAILSSNRTEACRRLQGIMGRDFNSPPANNPQATALTTDPQVQTRIAECKQLKAIAESQGNEPFGEINQRESRRQSLDGAINCTLRASFTIDYNACVSASKLYDGVRVAEKAMDMQQQVRTESNARKAQAEAVKKAAEGDMQTGVLDAGISNHDHMKGMMKEKIGAYMIAVGLLSKSLFSFPGEKKAREVCKGSQSEIPQQTCEQTVSGSKNSIVANGDTKMALVTAIAEFTAKGIAAQRAMKMHDDASDAIAKAKQPYDEEPQDLMLERCQFNPADPACLTPGERVSGGGIARGEFGMGEGGNNAFNLNPESGEFGEVGVETSLDDGNEVASLNNPFSDDAKRANGILNPAAAAQVQAAGGAGGGSGGGVGGGMGGGGASLGSDLAGADKDGDKEAQIKAGKVSGIYGAAGGGGYRGIARSKENANPFASLFDKKGAGGGTEIDGSIPADIDGKASGLFQKISKRYTRIHADKRIEARNLE